MRYLSMNRFRSISRSSCVYAFDSFSLKPLRFVEKQQKKYVRQLMLLIVDILCKACFRVLSLSVFVYSVFFGLKRKSRDTIVLSWLNLRYGRIII